MRKVIATIDDSGQLMDDNGMIVGYAVGMIFKDAEGSTGSVSNGIDGETLLRVMKIAAHVSDAEKIVDI